MAMFAEKGLEKASEGVMEKAEEAVEKRKDVAVKGESAIKPE